MQNNNPKPTIKNIEVGQFYFIHDGSKTGHPGFIVWKDDEMNLYIAIKFGTSKSADNELLLIHINDETTNYIYKRLFVGKRKDFSKNILDDFNLTNEVIHKYRILKNNNLKFSKNVSEIHKRFLNKNKNNLLPDIKK